VPLPEQPALARSVNEYAAQLCSQNPEKFSFFAALPSLFSTEACLAEIAYALDVLKADGVTLFTRYGDGNNYLGHPPSGPSGKSSTPAKQSSSSTQPTLPPTT
jgi:6-methylsalicylate decarboxylase